MSERVDRPLATLLKMVVSDGIIAPSFDGDALEILRSKKRGQYLVLQIDPGYDPPEFEERTIFGFVLSQQRNSRLFNAGDIADPVVGRLTDSGKLDLLVALTTLKYTQSNSIVCAVNGQTTGVGAGQQSRIDCTRIACHKSDVWRFRQHPAIRSLLFNPSVKRQDRINWRVRLIAIDNRSPYEDRILWSAVRSIRSVGKTQDSATDARSISTAAATNDASGGKRSRSDANAMTTARPPIIPTTVASATGQINWRAINKRMERLRAPSARRMPISLRRSATL